MASKIQFRRDTAVNWTTANPVLASGELGLETDSSRYKIGDGATAWNSLAYGGLDNASNTELFNGQASTPAAPGTNALKVFAKSLSGRMLLRQIGPTGLSTPLQPSFFQNMIVMINTSATTSLGTIGNSVTSTGTISHPTPTEQYGWMANFVTAGTAAATAGTSNNGALWVRGSQAGSNGWFMASRFALPDSSYNETGAGTGTRILVGLSSVTFATAVTTDDPGGHGAMFLRRSINGGAIESNWQFLTRDGTNTNVVDTGMAFTPLKVYDAYIFCPPYPNNGTIYWRIDNVTDGTTAEGSTSTRLPGATTYMRMGIQLYSADAVVRNIRLNRIYGEADK